MSDVGDDLSELIARARGEGPSAERLASVRARLEAQLGPLDPTPAPAPARGATAKVALGVTALALAIALVSWLVTRSASPEAHGELEPPAVEPVAALPEQADAAELEPLEPVAAPGAEAAPPPPREPARVVRTARRAAPEVDDAPASSAASALPEASTLREEIALLDRALRARESGDAARAVAALEEHRARFPAGRLRPERERMLAELGSPPP